MGAIGCIVLNSVYMLQLNTVVFIRGALIEYVNGSDVAQYLWLAYSYRCLQLDATDGHATSRGQGIWVQAPIDSGLSMDACGERDHH